LSPATRARLLPVLVIVLLLALLATAFLAYRYAKFEDGPAFFVDDSAVVSDSERASALAVAEQFALRMDQIDGKDLDGYTKGVLDMLTTKARAEFEKQFEATRKLGLDEKTQGTGKVLATGLSEIDRDSATALVVHDSVVTTGKDSTGRHFRWQVTLRKVDGEWRIDDFDPVD
jgi:hypothetical protein